MGCVPCLLHCTAGQRHQSPEALYGNGFGDQSPFVHSLSMRRQLPAVLHGKQESQSHGQSVCLDLLSP